jgi:hypothetical protein
VFAGCVGLGYAGALGAALAVTAVFALGAWAASYAGVRRYLDEQRRAHARTRRERARLKQLRPTGAARLQHYHELRALVEAIERLDPAEAARFELQDLLDHWIRIALDHQRCADSLRISGAGSLPASPFVELPRSKRRRDIQQRRIQHRDACVRRMAELADELDGVDELVRLLAQRAACPALEDGELHRELDRRLWELDEVDAALHQLSA